MHDTSKQSEIYRQLISIIDHIERLPEEHKTGTVLGLQTDIHSVINYIENG